MSAGEVAPVFVAWEEQVICQERGSRVVHFYLRDASGNSVLAVVGTERSVRHMMYVVPDQFLQTYGSTHPINACKWRARREVADWLTCLVSQNRPHQAGVQLDDSAQVVESVNMLTAGINGINVSRKTLPDKLISRKLKFQSSDIEWSGIAWLCAKQLKHYPGFCRNGTAIYVHSFVYLMAEEENHYIGYLEDMYEDKKKQKKVKVRWFHHGQEVKHVVPQLCLHEGEVFITPHVQVVSAECVNGPAIVLTPKHFKEYQAAVPHTSVSEIHICFRQFKNNKLKPFTLTKLRGYANQSILSCLDTSISKRKAKCQKSPTEGDENITQNDLLLSTNKRSRISTGPQVLEKGSSALQNSAPMNGMAKCEPKYPSLKLKLSRKTMGIKVAGPEPQESLKVGEKIEVLSQDSGIRGCWFRCKILSMSTSQRRLKVQHEDVLDVLDSEKLEEWVPASRVAAPDKLGMRCSGRLTVRPRPPEYTAGDTFEVGAAVDAWWCDGWWEGVITAVNASGDGMLQVYCPGEERLLLFKKKNLRISRDWIDNKWVDIMGKPDICSYLSPNVSSGIRLSANSAVVDGSMSVESNHSSIAKIEVAQKVEPEISGLEAPEDPESTKGTTSWKPLHAIDEDKGNSGGSSDDGTDNADDERKPVDAFDEEDKDNSGGAFGEEDKDNSGGAFDEEDKDNSGGGSDNSTDNDDGADKTKEESEENVMMEENFDRSEAKLDAAAEAIQVA